MVVSGVNLVAGHFLFLSAYSSSIEITRDVKRYQYWFGVNHQPIKFLPARTKEGIKQDSGPIEEERTLFEVGGAVTAQKRGSVTGCHVYRNSFLFKSEAEKSCDWVAIVYAKANNGRKEYSWFTNAGLISSPLSMSALTFCRGKYDTISYQVPSTVDENGMDVTLK